MQALGDFNGDGKVDLIVGGESDASSEIFLGNEDGTFQQPIDDFLLAVWLLWMISTRMEQRTSPPELQSRLQNQVIWRTSLGTLCY